MLSVEEGNALKQILVKKCTLIPHECMILRLKDVLGILDMFIQNTDVDRVEVNEGD